LLIGDLGKGGLSLMISLSFSTGRRCLIDCGTIELSEFFLDLLAYMLRLSYLSRLYPMDAGSSLIVRKLDLALLLDLLLMKFFNNRRKISLFCLD
jgi:hypothetical protein